jgi:hypothetical protein
MVGPDKSKAFAAVDIGEDNRLSLQHRLGILSNQPMNPMSAVAPNVSR